MWVVIRPIPTKREADGSLFESKILVKSPKPRNEAQRKVDYKNYDVVTYEQKLSWEILRRNYQQKLWREIMS